MSKGILTHLLPYKCPRVSSHMCCLKNGQRYAHIFVALTFIVGVDAGVIYFSRSTCLLFGSLVDPPVGSQLGWLPSLLSVGSWLALGWFPGWLPIGSHLAPAWPARLSGWLPPWLGSPVGSLAHLQIALRTISRRAIQSTVHSTFQSTFLW